MNVIDLPRTATVREQLAGIIDPNTAFQRTHVQNGMRIFSSEWEAALAKADTIIAFHRRRKPTEAMLDAMASVFFEWLGRMPSNAMLEEAYVAATEESSH